MIKNARCSEVKSLIVVRNCYNICCVAFASLWHYEGARFSIVRRDEIIGEHSSRIEDIVMPSEIFTSRDCMYWGVKVRAGNHEIPYDQVKIRKEIQTKIKKLVPFQGKM